MARIYYAGDSTAAQNTVFSYPQTGMGQGLSLYLKREHIVQNFAINGRSTKSFLEEGRLSAIRKELNEGDFLLIQFGHNDEKIEDPSRYTTPFNEYQTNLMRFIRAAREVGAHPVLITPLSRRIFDAYGVLKDTHGDYPEAMRQLGCQQNVPVIDLSRLSFELLEQTGDEESKKWFMYFPSGCYPNYPEGKTDNTHLRYEGAIRFAGILAEEFRKLGGLYADLLLDEFSDNPNDLID